MNHYPIWMICACCLVLHACLDVAQDRALLEQKIGQLSHNKLTLDIKDGLGSIHVVQESQNEQNTRIKIKVWAQAPHLTFTINSINDQSSQRPFYLELEVHNIMKSTQIQTTPTSLSQKIKKHASPSTILSFSIPLTEDSFSLQLIPPQPQVNQPWHFALFADVQERLDGLSDLLVPLSKEDVKFALISGDLTSQGTRRDLITFQKKIQKHLSFPCYATLGNHELGTPGPPFHKIFGRGNFSFEYGAARFTLLDSASATLAPVVRTQLQGWLQKGKQDLHAVIMHIPLLDPDGTRGGAFASRLEAMEIFSTLKRHKVDVLLFGHVHTYRTFYHAGIHTIISGGGGSIPMRLDGIGRHYVLFEVDTQKQRFSHSVRPIYPAE